MPTPITVPRLGWNMEFGTFVEWLKPDGDSVRPGEPMFRLEGEKSVEEIEGLDAGILSIPADGPKPGDRVAVGAVIGYLLEPGEAPPQHNLPAAPAVQETQPAPVVEPAASPSVRRMARERGIDLATVQGTGRDGRVTVKDMERATRPEPTAEATEPAISPRARRLAARHGLDWARLRGTGQTGRIRERDVAAAVRAVEEQIRDIDSGRLPADVPAPTPGLIPLTATRKATATRMAESHRNTAPVTLTTSVDASNLVNLRQQFKTVGSDDDRPAPSYTDFLVKLAGAALQKHPLLASRWADDGIRPADRIDIGIAVDTDAGLLVPVIRDVPALGLRAVAARSRELIDRARKGRLPARDMDGGCFTITNLGAYGVDAFTPIINPPESAILGVGRIDRRPAIRNDKIVARDQLTLSLTFDHRVMDGGPAARFLQMLALLIENPGPWVST